jgi:outer membrane PBP1 activator LpoA protein
MRLYGMGVDAYGLISSLYASEGSPVSMPGLSGELSLDEHGRIRRSHLPLAQFRNGRPVALETPAAGPINTRGFIGQR